MRASVISALTKNVPSLSRRSAVTAGVAALVISAGLPLLPGAGAAAVLALGAAALFAVRRLRNQA